MIAATLPTRHITQCDAQAPEMLDGLNLLGQYLHREGFEGWLARLAHHHFWVGPEEAVLTEASLERELASMVVDLGIAATTTPIGWQFSVSGDESVVVEWCRNCRRASAQVESQWAQIGAFLASHGLTGLIGIARPHDHDSLRSGQGWLETTNEVARTQIARRVSRLGGFADAAAATWRFEAGRPVVMGWCKERGVH